MSRRRPNTGSRTSNRPPERRPWWRKLFKWLGSAPGATVLAALIPGAVAIWVAGHGGDDSPPPDHSAELRHALTAGGVAPTAGVRALDAERDRCREAIQYEGAPSGLPPEETDRYTREQLAARRKLNQAARAARRELDKLGRARVKLGVTVKDPDAIARYDDTTAALKAAQAACTKTGEGRPNDKDYQQISASMKTARADQQAYETAADRLAPV